MKYGNISTSITLESFNNAPKPSVTLFFYGCNFKCGFCHNAIMLGNVPKENLMSEEHLKKVLTHAKRTWKKMVVICGGEPTLSPQLPDLLRHLKHDWDFEIKLDTNGSRPDVLKELFAENLVDYVAMDIKGIPEQYEPISKFNNLDKINESIELIKTNLDDYEFRTTVLPNFHTKENFVEIGKWLKGSKRFYLQQFRPDLANGCLDESYTKLQKIPKQTLEEYGEVLKPYIDKVKVR